MSKYADKQKRLKEDETFGYTYDIEEKGMVVEEKSEEDSILECVRPVGYEEDLSLKRESLAKKRNRIEFIKNEIKKIDERIERLKKHKETLYNSIRKNEHKIPRTESDIERITKKQSKEYGRD